MRETSGNKFSEYITIDPELARAAKTAIQNVLAVEKGERVLIITNPEHDVQLISQALYDATLDASASPTIVSQPIKDQFDFAEECVINAIRSNPEVVISISKKKMGKDKNGLEKHYKGVERNYDHIFDYLWKEKKIRTFWSPGITTKIFSRLVPIDYASLQKLCKKLKEKLDKAIEIHIMAPKGTNITIGLRDRKTRVDDGDMTTLGKGGNLPAGEVYISPELGSSNGTIVFDGSMSIYDGVVLIKEPITVKVKNGFVTSITGGREAEKLRESIKRGEETAIRLGNKGKISKTQAKVYAKNTRNLGELGIGLNKKARIMGNMLEDEKTLGTCHIAIGSNYDEDAKTLIHLDGIIKKPTITTTYKDKTREKIIEKGRINC